MKVFFKAAIVILVSTQSANAFSLAFQNYTTQIGRKIVATVSNKYRVLENTPYCRNGDGILGYVSFNKPRTFGICTQRIVLGSLANGQSAKPMINETVYHEGVHAAQGCHPKYWVLGLRDDQIRMSNDLWQHINEVTSGLDPRSRRMEIEAYFLEDKPQRVLEYVRRYC